MSDAAAQSAPLHPLKRRDIGLGIALLSLLVLLAWREGGVRLAALALVGAFAGLALYHAAFGFTAAWRRFILERKSAGLRAQVLMLALCSVIFFPLLGLGEFMGQPVQGYVFEVGLALVLGAFIFGIGMQLGGGCGSGTLFTIGGGSVRMLVTLLFFIIGSTLATAFGESWMFWPKLPAFSLIWQFGALPGLVLVLGALGLLFLGVRRLELSRHGVLVPIAQPRTNLLSGPWSLLTGALALAIINIATLLISGWPWGITSAFALWGSKAAQEMGFEPAKWVYWQGQEASLTAPVLAHVTSVMDFGIILGAMLAAMLAHKFRPSFKIPLRSLVAAMLGGLLLGIGARLGTGCNIGAFFSGVVSGSLHGWVWLVFAFAGNMLGVKLRPLFRLD
jgi:uncharacterized protein